MHINLPTKLRCDYLCSTCGYRGSVEYNDPDAIAEPEPIPGNSRLLAEQAFRAAEVALEKKAQRSLGLLRCPSCQNRDRKLTRRAYRRALLPLVAIAPVLFMFCVIATAFAAPGLIARAPWAPVVVGAAALLTIGPVVVGLAHRRLLREADSAARFLPGSGPQPT